jgi:hypothetical protein
LQTVEAVLGHTSGSRAGIVGVYQRHTFLPEQRAALVAWALEVERIVAGKRATPAGRRLFATATLVGESALTAKATIQGFDPNWITAVRHAGQTKSLKLVITYLKAPGIQLGPGECWWLRELLDAMQLKHKKQGRPVPIGQQAINRIGFDRVKELQRTKGLSQRAAIDAVVRLFPDEWFAHDGGHSLFKFMKQRRR